MNVMSGTLGTKSENESAAVVTEAFSWMGKQRQKENRPRRGFCGGHCQRRTAMRNVSALRWGRQPGHWQGLPSCPLAWRWGPEVPFCGWYWLGAAARGRAWEGSSKMRCPSTVVGSWRFGESKHDPKPCRSSWKPRLSWVGGWWGVSVGMLIKKHLFVPVLHYGVVCFVPIHGKRMNYFFVSWQTRTRILLF